MSESTVKAQQCLRAFMSGNYYQSLSIIHQVEEPHNIKDDQYGNTLLHLAAARGWLTIIQQLLHKYHFYALSKCNDGSTPLHRASFHGQLNVVEYLITQHTMCKTNIGCTPLHLAAINGHLNVVEYLITQLECDTMCRDNQGFTPLHHAAYNGHLNVVEYLITQHKCDTMCKRTNRSTPLHEAAYNGHLDVVDYLITRHKCDTMCKRTDGSTPLHLACWNGQLNVVEYLITQHKCETMCKDNQGSTPLHDATRNGHLNVVEYLITRHKCDTMCRDNQGSTLLHHAAYNGHLNVVEYLITQHKCDTMCRDNQGSTLLHHTAYNGHLNVVEYLIIQHKCDTMCKNIEGSTPLHDAASNGHLDVVQYLIDTCKCDTMCKNIEGSTPLHDAASNGHLDVVQYLIDTCKCDPMCKMHGYTPLDLAVDNSHHLVIEYLISTGRVNPQTRNISFQRKMVLPSGKEPHEVRKVFSKLNSCISADSYVNVVLLGNPGAGKSTLAQVIMQTSSGRHLFGRFKYVKGVELHTAGIVPSRIEHHQLGNVILHDLAGQPEYYSSHIAVLENLLQDYPAVFINLVNLCDEEALKSLHKWITVIENVSQNVSSPCHVVTLASHVDMITPSKFSNVKDDIVRILSSRLDSSNVVNDGVMGLDCRKLGGGDLSPFMTTLSNSCQAIRSAYSINLSLYCRMLYNFLENEKTVVHRVDKLCHLMAARKVSETYYVPQEQEEILETLSTLHSTGLITFLKNEHTPGNSWVVVDKRVLLAKVNGDLFSLKAIQQQNISSSTGEII